MFSSKFVPPVAFGLAALIAGVLAWYVLRPVPAASAPLPTLPWPGAHVVSVDASRDGCVHTGSATSGVQVFAINNTTSQNLQLTVDGAADEQVYAELDPLGPQSTRYLRVQLGPGSYHFVCHFTDYSAIAGAPFVVTGAGQSGPHARAVTMQDLIPLAQRYQAWVAQRLPALVDGAHKLRADLTAGNVPAAKQDWTNSHNLYETLGAAYDAFGDANDEINPVDGSSGFHKIEIGLWGDAKPAELTADADKLSGAVEDLQKNFLTEQVGALDIGLRAHEITENTLQFVLSGQTDYGSHTALSVAEANLAGTHELLDLLQPLLADRYPGLSQTEAQLAATQAVVTTLKPKYEGVKAISGYELADRQLLNAQFSQLCEDLAPVAALTDIRVTQ